MAVASEVDICNLALANVGESSLVTSISPPDGSIQADHCARFYPIARDALLEMHAWGFATRRIALALLGEGWPEWTYTYAAPAGAVNIMAILPPDATDDIGGGLPDSYGGTFSPQPFSVEVDASGNQVIYSDQVNAVARCTMLVEDTTKFSPLFVVTLGWQLAGMLAGVLVKGEDGIRLAAQCNRMVAQYISQAKGSDAGQRRVRVTHVPSFIAARG